MLSKRRKKNWQKFRRKKLAVRSQRGSSIVSDLV